MHKSSVEKLKFMHLLNGQNVFHKKILNSGLKVDTCCSRCQNFAFESQNFALLKFETWYLAILIFQKCFKRSNIPHLKRILN